jgi:NAD(P)H-dependent FMN reductase
VTPQYNWSAALKNALDYLYKEWNGKPAAMVTYGSHGGRKCAEQLQQVLTGLKMSLPTASVCISITRGQQQHGIDFETAQRDLSEHRAAILETAGSLVKALCQSPGHLLQAGNMMQIAAQHQCHLLCMAANQWNAPR